MTVYVKIYCEMKFWALRSSQTSERGRKTHIHLELRNAVGTAVKGGVYKVLRRQGKDRFLLGYRR